MSTGTAPAPDTGTSAVDPAPPGPPGDGPGRSRRRLPLWTVLVAVLVAALVVGSGLLGRSAPTPAQRAAAIESALRCPSCEDLSVAASSAPTAVAVRATVARLIGEGRSDQEITDFLTARYGSSIVLAPPARGWSALVWVLPVAGGVAAAAVLAVVLVRRRRAGDPDLSGADRSVLEERRRFLEASLADADAELAAGDLAPGDHAVLRRRDEARLAAVTAALDDLDRTAGPAAADGSASDGTADGGAAPAPRRLRIRRSRWFLVGALACFALAAALAVPAFTSGRLPGQTPTGSVALSPSQQTARTLDQAATLADQGQVGQAAALYQSVLTAHPDNTVALAQLGWLEYRIGRQGASASLLADARQKLDRAATLAPGDWAPHLYLGTILQEDGDPSAAVAEFQHFLDGRPPASVVAEAAPVLRLTYAQAGQPLPAGVPAG